MGWLGNRRRGRAIKTYARRLPRLLVKDCGGADAYSPAQIRASILRHGSNAHFESHAAAMLSDRESFQRFGAKFGEPRGYDEVRREAALTDFGGGSDLNALGFLAESGLSERGPYGAAPWQGLQGNVDCAVYAIMNQRD